MSDDPLQTSVFDVHTLHGNLNELQSAVESLLGMVNRQWRRRQFLALGIAGLALLGGVYLLFIAQYLFGLGALILAAATATLGFSSARFLAVEIETLTLVLALLEELSNNIDGEAESHLILDLRSSVHAKKASSVLGGGDEIVDDWFDLRLPLDDGFGIELVLTEHVHANAGRQQTGKRLGRDYQVALFSSHLFREVALCERVTSHVSAPTGTSVASRVREGLDAFEAAVVQLREEHAGGALEFQTVDIDDPEERDTSVVNPRAHAARAEKRVAKRRPKEAR